MIDLEALGITQEELQERIVEKAVDQILDRYQEWDEDADDYVMRDQAFHNRINKAIKDQIDKLFSEYADKHIMPLINERISDFVINQTNRFGEKTGKSLTLTEYLIEFAEAWMKEQVDSFGKSKQENSSYSSFSPKGSRLQVAIDNHLDFHIKNAMTAILESAHKTLGESLSAAVQTQLKEIAKKIKVDIKTK